MGIKTILFKAVASVLAIAFMGGDLIIQEVDKVGQGTTDIWTALYAALVGSIDRGYARIPEIVGNWLPNFQAKNIGTLLFDTWILVLVIALTVIIVGMWFWVISMVKQHSPIIGLIAGIVITFILGYYAAGFIPWFVALPLGGLVIGGGTALAFVNMGD